VTAVAAALQPHRSAATTANGTRADATGPVSFEAPPPGRWLFGSSKAAWIWLIARLWLGA
jgi:hypothetical protein